MKAGLTTLLSIFILSSGLFLFACDNKSSGVLIPSIENGGQLGDTNAKNDTAYFSTAEFTTSVFGGWVYNFTPPPNGKNERANFDFTYTIENKGKSDLVLDLKKSEISGSRIENFRQLSVTELSSTENQGLNAPSQISSNTVTIKVGEKRTYVDYFAASLKGETTIAADEVIYKMPPILEKGKVPAIKFKCVSSSDIEYLRREPPRPQN